MLYVLSWALVALVKIRGETYSFSDINEQNLAILLAFLSVIGPTMGVPV